MQQTADQLARLNNERQRSVAARVQAERCSYTGGETTDADQQRQESFTTQRSARPRRAYGF